MKMQEVKKIRELRNKGLSYMKIAEGLNLSVDTIKSYCKRNGLGKEFLSKRNKLSCSFCAKPVEQNLGRKKKRFCSNVCRNKWWSQHPNLMQKKANYACECLYCHTSFISYGNKKRKYCCHACYIKHHFRSANYASN